MASPTPRPAALAAPHPDARVAPELGAWRAFLLAHARLVQVLDSELRAAHGISLAEYDALLQVAQAEGRRLRMSVLAERVLLSRSGITRLVDRLVAAGLVTRLVCPTDARGAEAGLTPAGLDRVRAASATHVDGVRRWFLDVVPADERAVLERALLRVTAGLAAPEGACTA